MKMASQLLVDEFLKLVPSSKDAFLADYTFDICAGYADSIYKFGDY